MKLTSWISPDWPVPPGIGSVITTRGGGVSEGPWAGLNLGAHVGDAPESVAANRAMLAAGLPAMPVWLEQVHGTRVARVDEEDKPAPADAAVSRTPGRVLAIMTADCLPVLLCRDDGSVVGAAHAGWRGLVDGILEATVAAMECPPASLLAYLGPAIGPAAFEVGPEVRDAFLARDPGAEGCFRAGAGDRLLADLYGLARRRLATAGVTRVYGTPRCTYSEAATFYSYRRDGTTGRMASLIWIRP